jgi:thiosulfate dehydrogenase [quinone] large subunit
MMMQALPRLTTVAIAALRIYAGLFWLDKGVRQKLMDPTWVGPQGDCAFVVHEMLAKAPVWYAAFLHAVVVPNVGAFSVMVECGETLVGVSLFLGLFTRFGAIAGLFLVLNYFLGNGAGSLHDAWFGLDTVTFMMTVWHAVLPTGTILGLDRLIRDRVPAARLPGAF